MLEDALRDGNGASSTRRKLVAEAFECFKCKAGISHLKVDGIGRIEAWAGDDNFLLVDDSNARLSIPSLCSHYLASSRGWKPLDYELVLFELVLEAAASHNIFLIDSRTWWKPSRHKVASKGTTVETLLVEHDLGELSVQYA